MNKKYLIIALLGITTLVHATSYTVFSGLNCYNSYSCSLPVSNIPSGSQITDCTFTFNTVNTSGLLYCNLLGNNTPCTVGSQNGSTTTWTCTLNSTCLDYLNKCLSSGNCDFGISCFGNCHIGNCTCNYDCTPPTKNVPDSATTVIFLGLTLVGLEVSRRKFATAK